MLKGLNVHLSGPLGPVSAGIAAKQFKLIRFDVPSALSNLGALHEESLRNGLKLLPIVENVEHILAIPAPLTATYCGVELFNEPNIGRRFTSAAYAARIAPMIEAALSQGLTPWVGCIYNLHPASQDWLADVLRRLPTDMRIGVTIHRYPWGSTWEAPAKGFITREAETDAVKKIIGGRRFGLSEFGFTEERLCNLQFSWNYPFIRRICQQWSSYDVLTLIRQEFAWWQTNGAEFAVVYQLNNGPIGSDEQYGIRTHPDGIWKPQADCCL